MLHLRDAMLDAVLAADPVEDGLEDVPVAGTVYRRKATITPSSSIENIVEVGFFRPVGTSTTDVRFFHLATVFWLIP